MQIKLSKPLLFYPLLAAFVFLDFFGVLWFDLPSIHALFALFAVVLSCRINRTRLLVLLFAFSLESFLVYGQLGAQLLYLLPVVLITRSTWDKFTHVTHHALLILFSCIIAQFFIIDALVGTNLFSIFTLVKVMITILLTISISLTYV